MATDVTLTWLRQRLSWEKEALTNNGKRVETAQRRLNKAFENLHEQEHLVTSLEKAIKVIEEL